MKNSLYPILYMNLLITELICDYFIQWKILKPHTQSHFSPRWPYTGATVESILVKQWSIFAREDERGKSGIKGTEAVQNSLYGNTEN